MRSIHSSTTEFLTGARDIFPLIVGAVPFGLIFGTLATSNGLSTKATLAMSAFVFAGSSQFIAAGMAATNASWLLIALTTFVVNLRHLLYAVSLLPYVKKLSQKWKIPLAFLLTDEAFAVTIRHYQLEQTDQQTATTQASNKSGLKHWYFLGAALTMYTNWQLCTLIGVLLGQAIPDATSWGLDFAMSVTFIGMIIPYIKNKPMLTSVIVAGTASLLTASLPHKLGLMISAIVGITAGVITEGAISQKKT